MTKNCMVYKGIENNCKKKKKNICRNRKRSTDNECKELDKYVKLKGKQKEKAEPQP